MNGPDLLIGLKEATATERFDNISDDKYYKWLSRSHEKIAEYIKAKVDSKFFLSITQTDLVAGQGIYDNIGEVVGSEHIINVIGSVWVKYDGQNFTKLPIRDFEEMNRSREDLLKNQPTSDPFCTIVGDKLMIFPAPKMDVQNGIELTGKKDVLPITAGTTKSEIFNGNIPHYSDYIIKGAEQYVFKYLSELQKEKKSREEFMYQDLPRIRTELSYRGSQPVDYQDNGHLLNNMFN